MLSSVNSDYIFKYIIIGDPSVGKSQILLRYVNDIFNEEYQTTIGVEFGAKNLTIKDLVYRIQIWDTAGQENFKSITRAYYKNSVCVLIVYDISKKTSFDNVYNWIQDCRNQSPKTILMILIGNKKDLDYKREVNYEEGKEFADKFNMLFYETSAKTGDNIDKVFFDSANEIIQNMENGFYDLDDEKCGIKKSVTSEKFKNQLIKENEDEQNKVNKKKCC